MRNHSKPGSVPAFRRMGWVFLLCRSFSCPVVSEVVDSVWIPERQVVDRWCSCPWWWSVFNLLVGGGGGGGGWER